jgi:hypothetical protein
MSATDRDKMLVLQAFAKPAALLGVGPTKPNVPAVKPNMAKPKPLSPVGGTAALTSLAPSMRGPQTKTANTNDAAAKAEEKDTKPEVVKLESASDTPPKKAPEKKPEAVSENAADYNKKADAVVQLMKRARKVPLSKISSFGKKAAGAAGALKRVLMSLVGPKSLVGGAAAGIGRPIARRVGALSKLPVRGMQEGMGKSMPRNILAGVRTALQNAAQHVGAGAARIGRGGAGTQGAASAIGAGALGLGGLGAMGLGRASKAAGLRKAAITFEEEPTGLSAPGAALGALAGAGVPVAAWQATTPLLRAGPHIKKFIAALEKLPSTHARLTKALMYSPAVLGALIGLTHRKEGSVKRAAPMDERVAPDPQPQKDIVPGLGPLGGHVLGGLGKVTGGLGLPRVSKQLQDWSESPTARSLAGGGTAILTAIMAALAAKKLMHGREEEVEPEAA